MDLSLLSSPHSYTMVAPVAAAVTAFVEALPANAISTIRVRATTYSVVGQQEGLQGHECN